MRVKIEDSKKACQKLIKIEIEPQKVKEALDETYKSIAMDATIPGFRKGKAPRDLLETHYGDAANDEAIKHLVWDAYRDVIKTNGVEPISYPIIEDVKFDRNGPLHFTVKVDVKPTIALKSYTDIKVKELPVDVSEEDVKNALEAVQQACARLESVEGRSAETGDYVLCDYECMVDGKPVDNQKNVWLCIEEESSFSPIPENLIGCSKGEIKEAEIILPQNYKQPQYSGKKAIYKITIKEIKKKILPQINDELAKQAGDFKDLQQLKERLKEQILLEKKHKQRYDAENQLFDFLLKTHQFDVPESLVERQLQDLVNDAKIRLGYQGHKKEEIEPQVGKLKQTLAINAERHVKIFFILEEIAEKENISITDEELNEQIKKLSESTKQDFKNLKQAMQEQDLIGTLRKQLLHDKVVGFLFEKAKTV